MMLPKIILFCLIICVSGFSHPSRSDTANFYFETGITSGFGTSLPCNINANCNVFAPFRYLLPGVYKIDGFGTAYLINNLTDDGRLLSITKIHDFPSGLKQGDSTTLTLTFNYEFPDCDNLAQEPQGITVTTSVQVLQFDSLADRVLFELLSPEEGFPANLNFQLLGWDINPTINKNDSLYTFGHPGGDVKKGAYLTVQDFFGVYIFAYVMLGAIEDGCSGSPVLNAAGRVVGDIKGGSLYGCESIPEAYAVINNLNADWGNLQPFLDPGGTGQKRCDVKRTALPVELTSFSGRVDARKIILAWKTATEDKNFGFDVERTESAKSEWVKIGFVNGHGNSNSPNSYAFTDIPAGANKYSYRLKQIDFNGRFVYSSSILFTVAIPSEYVLKQNYPNPFNPSTAIEYSLPEKSFVTLKVFDILGKEAALLVNENKEAGSYRVEFSPAHLNSGAYIYELQAGNFTQTKKMMLVK